jgi:hypothetical protein
MRRLSLCVSVLWLWCALGTASAGAQTIETVGERAMGMGGAFVAVADDSSATWWNPAALAAGPFLDVAAGWSRTEFREGGEPRGRTTPVAVSLSTPPVGVSYYRFRITDIQPSEPVSGPTVTPPAGREDGRVGVGRSLRLHDVGVTLLSSIFPGVHVGTTLKLLHGNVEHTTGDLASTSESQFDADLGVLAVAGPWRLGGVVRNLRAAEFGGAAGEGIRLPRQARIGVAFDGAARRGSDAAWTVSADVDVANYATVTGDRRVIAAGAERWLFGRRIGVRGGGRFNQIGHKERSATGGVSAAIRSGMFIEAHVVGGGSDDERGWGVGGRVSF